jgi:DNA modification methylase
MTLCDDQSDTVIDFMTIRTSAGPTTSNLLITAPSQDALQGFGPDCVDFVLTSPPYDDLRSYNGYSFPFEEIAGQLFRVVKPGGVVVWVVNDATKDGSETGTSFRQALHFQKIGFNLHDTMIFGKNNPMPSDAGLRYRQTFEYMFVFSKGKPKTFNPIMVPTREAGKKYQSFRATGAGRADVDEGVRTVKAERRAGNIFFYNVGSAATRDNLGSSHPAVFPERLAEDQILTWTNPGDVVLDPFSGSGTTGKMAVKNGRSYVGIDVSEEYNSLAEMRIKSIGGVKWQRAIP